jgi:predicted dehydrogenase
MAKKVRVGVAGAQWVGQMHLQGLRPIRGVELIAAGKLGEVYHAEATWIRARWPRAATLNWRVEREHGGGVLLDLGVHVIDEVWFCLGCPKPVEISANLRGAFRRFSSAPDRYTADDGAAGLIRFENGVTLSFRVAFCLNTAGPDGGGEIPKDGAEWRSVCIYGTHAGIDMGRGLFVDGGVRDVRTRPIRPVGKRPEFESQAREFVRAVRSGKPPISSASEGTALMKMLAAAVRSSDRGRSVRVR